MLELSFKDSHQKAGEIEKHLLDFFNAIKKLPRVEKVKIFLSQLNQKAITGILLENNETGNIHSLLEFQVEQLIFNVSKFPQVNFEGSPLTELFEIEQAMCPKIDGVQSYRVGYYFYPKA